MRRNYMDAYQQILKNRISECKKQQLKLLRNRPLKYHKRFQSTITHKQAQAKPKENAVTYIDKALKIMKETQSNMNQNRSLPIKIDNAYGDYAMSIFRKKDRIKRLEDIPKLFTKDFKNKIIDCFPPGNDKLVDDLIKGKVKASSFTSKSINKIDDFQGTTIKLKNHKYLDQLSKEMRYQYFAEQEPSQNIKTQFLQEQECLRSNSLGDVSWNQITVFLPEVTKVKKKSAVRGKTPNSKS